MYNIFVLVLSVVFIGEGKYYCFQGKFVTGIQSKSPEIESCY